MVLERPFSQTPAWTLTRVPPSFHPLSYRVAAFTAEVQPDMAAELLVSDVVDERAEQTRKHIGKQEAAEEDLGAFLGPSGD